MRAKQAFDTLEQAIEHACAIGNWSHAVDAAVGIGMIGGAQKSDAAFEYRFTIIDADGLIAIFSLTVHDRSRPFAKTPDARYRNRFFLALLRNGQELNVVERHYED
jgi:NAD(P)H-hydrate repair Nnr-like enzyme with NAD(P)H-hydrate dehydratase domain